MVDIRVGQGFDIHRFADTPIEGRVLILGGAGGVGTAAIQIAKNVYGGILIFLLFFNIVFKFVTHIFFIN